LHDNWCQKWDLIDRIIQLENALDCYIIIAQNMEQMMECLLAEMKAEIRANQAKMDAYLKEIKEEIKASKEEMKEEMKTGQAELKATVSAN
jgi:hypothetical protein